MATKDVDYPQIELRIMSCLAEGLDIHSEVAAEMFGCEIKDVTLAQRRKAKAFNYVFMYSHPASGQILNI